MLMNKCHDKGGISTYRLIKRDHGIKKYPLFREFLIILIFLILLITSSRGIHRNISFLHGEEYSRRLPCSFQYSLSQGKLLSGDWDDATGVWCWFPDSVELAGGWNDGMCLAVAILPSGLTPRVGDEGGVSECRRG